MERHQCNKLQGVGGITGESWTRKLPTPRRFSHPPRIVVFRMPEVIYPAIVCLYPEIEVIRFPPGLQDRANFDLMMVHQKRDGPFICPGTSPAPNGGTIPRFQCNLRHVSRDRSGSMRLPTTDKTTRLHGHYHFAVLIEHLGQSANESLVTF